jgi:hypothetical protein
MVVWKITRRVIYEVGKFIYKSRYAPRDRSEQNGFRPSKLGKDFTYEIGKTKTSYFNNTYGIYCYEKMKDAVIEAGPNDADYPILEITIPKGTRIRTAKDGMIGVPVILTEVAVIDRELTVDERRSYAKDRA